MWSWGELLTNQASVFSGKMKNAQHIMTIVISKVKICQEMTSQLAVQGEKVGLRVSHEKSKIIRL